MYVRSEKECWREDDGIYVFLQPEAEPGTG